MDKLASHTARHASLLKLVAQALDVSVEELLGEPSDRAASDLLALVRFWSAINDSQGRQRVLSIARYEAERCGYKGSF